MSPVSGKSIFMFFVQVRVIAPPDHHLFSRSESVCIITCAVSKVPFTCSHLRHLLTPLQAQAMWRLMFFFYCLFYRWVFFCCSDALAPPLDKRTVCLSSRSQEFKLLSFYFSDLQTFCVLLVCFFEYVRIVIFTKWMCFVSVWTLLFA